MDDFFTIDQPTPPSSSNGLPAQAWVAIGAIDPRLAEPLLDTLRAAGVGAYVAPFTSRRSARHLEMRLWVDASLRPQAERVVAAALPDLRESLEELDDERWSAIVASLESPAEPEMEAAWPEIEGYPSAATGLDDDDYDEYDDGEHFVPPEPEPLPPTNPVTKYGWMALLGGLVLLVVPALFGHVLSSGLLAIAIIAIVGGFLTLVMRLKDGPPTDSGPDDGAVI